MESKYSLQKVTKCLKQSQTISMKKQNRNWTTSIKKKNVAEHIKNVFILYLGYDNYS